MDNVADKPKHMHTHMPHLVRVCLACRRLPLHPQGDKALALPHLSVTDISSIDWAALRGAGIKVSDRVTHCRGSLTTHHRGSLNLGTD